MVSAFATYFCRSLILDMQQDWVKEWFGSPYYKILYQHRDEFEAQEFVENLLKYLEPVEGSRMLDIACGDGRHAEQLAEHGYDVTGIDIAHESIEKAKARENEHIHFYEHDMRMPFYINYFDYAFNFFTSFGYFTNDRDNLMAAKSFAKSLKKDGILVVDYLNKDVVLNNLVCEQTIERGSYTFDIKKEVKNGKILKHINFLDADNNPKSYTETVAAFSLSDFVALFQKAKLSLVGTFGDYQLNSYDPSTSPRLIMVFKK